MWAAYAAFVVFMTYVEGYKAFHRKFSPMVVARALTLRDAPLHHVVFAPFYAMGLFHASKKRLATSWGFVVGIAALVKLVKTLDYPWRAVVDGGGLLSSHVLPEAVAGEPFGDAPFGEALAERGAAHVEVRRLATHAPEELRRRGGALERGERHPALAQRFDRRERPRGVLGSLRPRQLALVLEEHA